MIYLNKIILKNNNLLNIIDNKYKLNRLIIQNNTTKNYIYLNIINYININLNLKYIYISLKKNLLISKNFFILYTNLINKNFLTTKNNYSLKLIINGVGYFFKINNNILTIKIEYSHTINIKLPETIKCTIENNGTTLNLTTFNKQLLTLIASKIKLLSKINKYKGKGIYYFNEKINLKIIKKLKAS
uniref:50S ribosomal protein L6 n=1 Tax=Nephromyces sp. ex Molgula occidentalis TaxID=2544991 RepID=A0A5C1H7S0_9APIC|nr:50S ribosomal protein L6 [Nephromyces sp. ex Molgula occidentalis]